MTTLFIICFKLDYHVRAMRSYFFNDRGREGGRRFSTYKLMLLFSAYYAVLSSV